MEPAKDQGSADGSPLTNTQADPRDLPASAIEPAGVLSPGDSSELPDFGDDDAFKAVANAISGQRADDRDAEALGQGAAHILVNMGPSLLGMLLAARELGFN